MTRTPDGARGVVIISDREHGLPYSKGLMANAIMTSGLSPARAYHVAQSIEDRLLAAERDSVTTEELRRIAQETIREEAGDRYAEAYLKWQQVGGLDIPLIILIGGATGVGKSTIATQLAARLGIIRMISTDAIREVMKSIMSPEIMPTLHVSSFAVDSVVHDRLPRTEDSVLVGFRDQVSAVSVGVKALIDRAVTEQQDVIIEGAHLVPGYVQASVGRKAVVVHLIIAVDDEDRHRSHFSMRALEARARPMERYLPQFGNIRKIQKYLKSLALQNGVPIIQNHSLDSTLRSVIDLVVDAATGAVKGRPRKVRALRGGARP